MLNHKPDYQSVNPERPLWTQEEAILFECAREILTNMIGICTHEIAKEKAKSLSDGAQIQQLEKKRGQLAALQTNLHWNDHETIARINRDYGQEVKMYRQQKQQKVV